MESGQIGDHATRGRQGSHFFSWVMVAMHNMAPIYCWLSGVPEQPGGPGLWRCFLKMVLDQLYVRLTVCPGFLS